MKNKFSIITLFILIMGLMAGVVSAQEGDGNRPGDRPGDRPGGRGDRNERPHPFRNAVGTIAEELGLEPVEFAQQIHEAAEGATLADIIAANGGDLDAIIGVLVANASEHINEAVTNERMTQERADELLADLETRITEMLNHEIGDRPEVGDRPVRGAVELFRIVDDWVEANTELSRADIREAMRDGATFGEVLTDAGVDLDAFAADVTAEVEAHLAEAVSNGDITQEQADTMLENFLEGLNNRLTMWADV